MTLTFTLIKYDIEIEGWMWKSSICFSNQFRTLSIHWTFHLKSRYPDSWKGANITNLLPLIVFKDSQIWKRNYSKCYWITKQIEHFAFTSQTHNLCYFPHSPSRNPHNLIQCLPFSIQYLHFLLFVSLHCRAL